MAAVAGRRVMGGVNASVSGGGEHRVREKASSPVRVVSPALWKRASDFPAQVPLLGRRFHV